MRILFFVLLLFTFAPFVMAAENGVIVSSQTEAHTHYCPMHLEETGVEGDNCPICGMHLVPMEEGSSSVQDPKRESQTPPSSSDSVDADPVYICPMHPHISGKEGDTCPICGMNLVPKNKAQGNEESIDKPEGAFRIDPSYIQTLGVKTSSVNHQDFGKNIRAFGKVMPSTRLEYTVDVRTKGWIVDLNTDAVGDTLKKGDLLFTYYSPDLMNAQSDFLIGSHVGNAAQRLRLYGMDNKAIKQLKERGKFFEETPFYASADGTVTILNVRKGAYVSEGSSILKLQDFSKVWINADVPIRDVQFFKIGTPTTITIPETGKEFETIVNFIHLVNDPQSRTVTVRLVLDNPEGTLKPNTYVDAVFNAQMQSRLAVPVEAVLYGSMGAYVIENVGDGYFRPVMVKTGITSQGLTEITSGLSHGQNIVISGQFMLDAESNLRGGMAAMGHDHGGDQMNDITNQPAPQNGGQIHAH
jgi:Cu(I)/Ag(I) efflux system membrane fusion protein